jgi:hypothetical protein
MIQKCNKGPQLPICPTNMSQNLNFENYNIQEHNCIQIKRELYMVSHQMPWKERAAGEYTTTQYPIPRRPKGRNWSKGSICGYHIIHQEKVNVMP